MPPNQPMIGDGSCARRRHGVTGAGGEQWVLTSNPWRGCAAPALDGLILWRRQFTNRVAAGAAIAPRSTTGATTRRAGFAEMRTRTMRPGTRSQPSIEDAGAGGRCWACSSATSLQPQRLLDNNACSRAAAHATHDASAQDEAGPKRPAADLPTGQHRPSTNKRDEGAASWPHQARRQHAARRRPGPSTPTL